MFPDPENMGWAFASGDSMINIGIFDGTPLLLHRKREPKHNDVVIGMIDGEQTVKVLLIADGKITLKPENENYQPIRVTGDVDFEIRGVVVNWLGKPFSR